MSLSIFGERDITRGRTDEEANGAMYTRRNFIPIFPNIDLSEID